MTDIVLTPITSGYNLAKINANFVKVQDVINNDVLHSIGGNNVMRQSLDMNFNRILNIFTDVNDPQSLLTVGVADSRYYNVSGDTLTGPMNANGQRILGLPAPASDSEPARKVEVDTLTNASVRVPLGETIPPIVPALTRANKVLGFDALGNPIATLPASGSGTELAIDLANSVDPYKGAALVARTTVAIKSIADLQVAPRRTDLTYLVRGYYTGTNVGGGPFYWDAVSTATHDGGGVVQVTGVTTGRFIRVVTGIVTPDMYGARPNDLAQDSAFAFRAALAANDTVWVPDNQYLFNSYLVGAYYGAPGIVLNRDGQSLLCGRNARLVCNHTAAASGGVGVNVMLQIANAANCTIGAFKIQPMAAVGTDLNSVDTLQMFNAPGAQIGAIDDTYRISTTSGSIQQSIIARDSPSPETSGTVYKEGFQIVGANLSATLNVKHHHNMRVSGTKVRIDLDAHRPAWMGSDVAPLKFTGGTINAKNAVAEDCEFTVYRSGGGSVAQGLGYLQITKCTATLSRCVINTNRIYGGSESEVDYPVPASPKVSTLHLADCDSLADLYFGPSFSIKVTGGSLGSVDKKIQIAGLNPPSPLLLSPELDVSGCDFYCNRGLSDQEAIPIDITFSDIDLYYTRITSNCFDVHRTTSTWFHADNVRSHLDSQGLFVIFSGNARLSNVWKKTASTTELRLESNSATNPTRVLVDGSFDYKDIFTSTGNLAYTTGIEAMNLYTATAPVLSHGGAYTRGSIIFNRTATANTGWKSDGSLWVSF